MRAKFCHTANVVRFVQGVERLEARGAAEACMMLVSGDAGYGKSRTGQWWAVQQDAVHIRVKRAATAHWILTDIVRELGEAAPARTCEKLYLQAVEILARGPRPIVVDEVENALGRSLEAIETIRDISDLVEVPVVLLGREYVAGTLRRHKQIWSRVSSETAFRPATLEDAALCAAELLEVEAEDEVVAALHHRSAGLMRPLVNWLKAVERIGLRTGRKVTLADLDGADLPRAETAASRNKAAA